MYADDLHGSQDGGGHAQLQATSANAETLLTFSGADSTGEDGSGAIYT